MSEFKLGRVVALRRPDGAARRPYLLLVALVLSSCATPDTRHRIVISIPEQRLALLDNGVLVATYPVSTSKFAIGDAPGSRATPLGELQIEKKIGDAAPLGTVFKDRRPTGEVLVPDAPGRDPIVTRILWLRGLETQNANAYGRYIYIHGTAEERNIGKRASYGCIRMRSRDVIQLYDIVGWRARVTILDQPLSAAVPLAPGPGTTTAVSSR
jgi:lipoprotein-anchoring transpeptidase ErfK/SrfK